MPYLIIALVLVGLAAVGFVLRRRSAAPAPPTTRGKVHRDDVRFTMYRPASVEPEQWRTLLVFAHRAEGAMEDGGHQPDLTGVVHREAQALLGAQAPHYRSATEDATTPVVRDSELAFVPEVDGVIFNPPRITLTWTEAVHRAEFRLKAAAALDGTTARGQLTIFNGPIVLAQMALVLRVSASETETDVVPSTVTPYRRVFASYAHTDAEIVQQVREYARAMGDEYLIDVTSLRAGEQWMPRLEALIREADVFQLFWSSNAMRSAVVRQEYEYALSLGRSHFIRPVYWEEPLPLAIDQDLPPAALRAVHFQRIGVAKGPVSPRPPVVTGTYGAVPAASSHRSRASSPTVRNALAAAAVLITTVGVYSQMRLGAPASTTAPSWPDRVAVAIDSFPSTDAAAPAPAPAPVAVDSVRSSGPTGTQGIVPMPGRPEPVSLLLRVVETPAGNEQLASYARQVRRQITAAPGRFKVTVPPPGVDVGELARRDDFELVASLAMRETADGLRVDVHLADRRRERTQDDTFVIPRDSLSAQEVARRVTASLARLHMNSR